MKLESLGVISGEKNVVQICIFSDTEAVKKIYLFGWKDFEVQNNLVSLIIPDQ